MQALVAEAVPIRQPGLIDGLAGLRHHPLDPAFHDMGVHPGAQAVVRRDGGLRGHLPGASRKSVGLAVQRPHRAEVDDVARELMIDAAFDVRGNLHAVTAADGAELLESGHFLGEAHAASAVDAAGHVRGHQRPDVLVLHHALALGVAGQVAAEAHGQVLQLALPTLVADGTVQRMIDQQEFHGRLLRADGFHRLRMDLHAGGDRRSASRERLGCVLDFDQAHAAIGRYGELAVVAEPGHVDADGVGHLAVAVNVATGG